jgi:pimeloyl-ACP methyl ester carboxylesterase
LAVPTLEVDGFGLHYERSGDGEPIVLLHGFTSSYVENWIRTGWVRRLLAEGFGVVGMDVRGHGRSAKLYAAAAYETSLLAADVVAVLDQLRIDRAHAVGFSMGAGIALQLALDHPARVGAVVAAGIGDKAIRGRHDAAEIGLIERGLKVGAADGADTNSLAGRIRRNAERAGNDRRALGTFFERGGWPGDLVSLGEVAAPVLVVPAEHDEFMPTADELVRKLGARVGTLDCGHASAVRDPRFVDLALSFIREHRLANRP